MASAAFPHVVSAAFDVATAALDGKARVVRGSDLSSEPGDVLLVGIQDIDEARGDAPATVGSFEQEMQTFGGNRRERGSVNGLVQAWDGNVDQEETFETAFGYLADLEAAVRADPTLGLTAFDYVVAEVSTGDVTEFQDDRGSGIALAFTIAYQARI